MEPIIDKIVDKQLIEEVQFFGDFILGRRASSSPDILIVIFSLLTRLYLLDSHAIGVDF